MHFGDAGGLDAPEEGCYNTLSKSAQRCKMWNKEEVNNRKPFRNNFLVR